MKRIVFLLVLMAFASGAAAANDEMRKLDWLVGEWQGEAVVRMGPEPQTVIQTERVQSKLGGKVLLIEGLGKRKLADGATGEVVHDALAVVAWDEAKKNYRFSTWLADRSGGEATLEVTGPTSAVWGMETPRGKMRYTLTLTESGEWLEIGEWSRDGASWMKFIEMRLKKVK